MATLSIVLTPELESLIEEKVSSGRFHSASDVVLEGLRLLNEQDEYRRLRIQGLKDAVRVGTDQLDRGDAKEFYSGEELAAQIEKNGRRLLLERENGA